MKNILHRTTFYLIIGALIVFLLPPILPAQEVQWGFQGHQYINNRAVDHLPIEMSFFKSQRDFLENHSTDPDTDLQPGNFHYIDIDFYPEFISGTLPHNLDDLIALYGESVVNSIGLVPWAIDRWTDSLTVLMAEGDWDNAWQVAAELGHYVADSHQPLHLTVNFNGQKTGNPGIHSRYETQVLNPRLSQLPLPEGVGGFWENVLDSVFLYINEIYPYVELIMAADDLAFAQDPNYSTVYFNALWVEVDSITIDAVHRAILDVASLWHTAWVNAGKPAPPTVSIIPDGLTANKFTLSQNYPNPFNPVTTIRYSLSTDADVSLVIYNILGDEVARFREKHKPAGDYQFRWDASNVASGIYFYSLQADGFVQTKKMAFLR